MTIAELNERMSFSEFQEWLAYYEINPFGEVRQDVRFGILGSVMATGFDNVLSMFLKNYRPKQHSIKDFMPRFEVKSNVEQQAKVEAMRWAGMAAVGAELERRRLAKVANA